jgi:predicted acylesterase/phospholipase RssA
LLNYNVSDIKNIIFDFDTNKVIEIDPDIDNLLTNYNVYKREKFEKFIKLLINFKYPGCHEITLHQLYKKTNKILTCATISLRQRIVKYFNHINQPNLPVYKLIMMTCAIPFAFRPVSWRSDKYIDGGILDNFPLFPIPANEINMTIGIRAKVKLCNKDPNFNDIYEYLTCLYTIVTMSSRQISLYNIITVTIDEKYSSNIVSMNIDIKERDRIIKKSYIKSEEQLCKFSFEEPEPVKKIKRRNSF